MSDKAVQRIINETAFTMEIEGFVLSSEEKDNIRKVLSGEASFDEQLKKYIDNAKHIGVVANAPK
jgi:hypothetical protein